MRKKRRKKRKSRKKWQGRRREEVRFGKKHQGGGCWRWLQTLLRLSFICFDRLSVLYLETWRLGAELTLLLKSQDTWWSLSLSLRILWNDQFYSKPMCIGFKGSNQRCTCLHFYIYQGFPGYKVFPHIVGHQIKSFVNKFSHRFLDHQWFATVESSQAPDTYIGPDRMFL